MKITRRNLIRSASVAAVAVAAPSIIRPNEARAEPWITKGGTIKVGVLFSQSGALAVVKCRLDADGAVQPGEDVGEGHADLHRLRTIFHFNFGRRFPRVGFPDLSHASPEISYLIY